MVEVKALYHFLDTTACRNRKQGDVFKIQEEYANELEERGLVVRIKDPPKVEQATEKNTELEPKFEEKTSAKDTKPKEEIRRD